MKYTYLTILTSFFLVSCEDFFETTLELEEPVFEEKLVVNSILNNTANLTSRALISKTIGLNDEIENSLIADAEVIFTFPDGTIYPIEHVESSYLYSSYNYEGQLPNLIAGENYTLSVNANGKSVTSNVTMPSAPQLISAIYSQNGGLNEDGDEVSAIDIIIDDNPEEENYYKIGANVILDGFSSQLYISSNNSLAIESTSYEDLLIKDDQFNGEDFKLRLQFFNYTSYYGGEPVTGEYTVTIRSITKEQYDHDRLLNSYFENNDNPFASPVQISSNIDGGIGLFSIENEKTYLVEQ